MTIKVTAGNGCPSGHAGRRGYRSLPWDPGEDGHHSPYCGQEEGIVEGHHEPWREDLHEDPVDQHSRNVGLLDLCEPGQLCPVRSVPFRQTLMLLVEQSVEAVVESRGQDRQQVAVGCQRSLNIRHSHLAAVLSS